MTRKMLVSYLSKGDYIDTGDYVARMVVNASTVENITTVLTSDGGVYTYTPNDVIEMATDDMIPADIPMHLFRTEVIIKAPSKELAEFILRDRINFDKELGFAHEIVSSTKGLQEF